MRWLFLFIASLFEALWTYSVKYFSLAQLKTIRFDNFYKLDGGLPALIPLLGYIIFGVGNIFFFSLALKSLSNSTAYSVWTAMTIVVLKLIELLYFKQKISVVEFCFIIMIIVGIMGLKFYGPPEKTI
ncbi:quaternary ammonium compound-resistance protein SugE [Mucilaginibacter gracilis]|uniref:Quaternary ammonium compound-resistance protein SugE n=1 Tax=Mucilaginibacter gracilis TaxID=423350 RepID=A0A495J2Y8_9SPHI|nr:SMR family transporter [Mucilaginibacter gracilis]RKR83041.1 quaternary ammonium compound-resistance protein SugE [Mucilaginibacter gracilis]